MKLFENRKARPRPVVAVESLEPRRLLFADIGISYDLNGDGKFDSGDSSDVNGDGVITDNEKNGRRVKENDSRQINLGTAAQSAAFFSNLFRFANEGDGTLSLISIMETFGTGLFTVLRANGQPLYPGGVLQQINLGAGQSIDLRFGVNTAIKGDLIDTIFVNSNDFDETQRRIVLRAQVIPNSPGGSVNWGLLTSGTKSQTFLVTGSNLGNTIGNSLVNITDQLIRFELSDDVENSIELTLGGVLRSDSVVKYGRPQAILTRDANGDGKLNTAEREAALATLTAVPPGSATSDTLSLSGGKYLIYLTAISGQTGAGAGSGQQMKLDATVSLDVNSSALPQIEVRGNDVVINNNDTTPSPGDGTSFGVLLEGNAPTLTFTVRNTGGSVLNITGQRPNISGDFIVVEKVNSTIAAGGSDSFTVQLINTGPGARSGTIAIQSNAGTFTFKIGGTLAPIIPPGSFVTRNGDQLTVTGTGGNDRITISSSFDNLVISRNGEASPAFSVRSIKGITVNSGAGNDKVTATTGLRINLTLNGGDGADTLRGAKGRDLLSGGAGKDRMDGLGGSDTLDGGGGPDFADYSSRKSDLTITLDTLANDGGVGEKDLILSNIEHVQGGKGDDHITGNSKNNILRGGKGDDVLIGGAGNDTLEAGAGTNNLSGGAGDDVLLAKNDRQDSLDGGPDDDDATTDVIDLITNVEN
jgi:Ca2+-binding RTX toxin-like protein